MKTKTITTYQFDELSEDAKEKARTWFREGQFDYDWWDFTYEDTKNVLGLMGYQIDKIFFSGFSSQGDGACFEGSWSASNVKPGKAQKEFPQDKEIHRIAKEIERLAKQDPDASLTVKQSGHYQHSFCTQFDVTSEVPEAEDLLIEVSRDAMNWIYRQLETQYDAMNENEYVDDSIRANGYEFSESGSRSVTL